MDTFLSVIALGTVLQWHKLSADGNHYENFCAQKGKPEASASNAATVAAHATVCMVHATAQAELSTAKTPADDLQVKRTNFRQHAGCSSCSNHYGIIWPIFLF